MALRVIEELESRINSAIKTEWPSICSAAGFKPLVDLGLGDIGSSCFIELAGLLKHDPRSIGQKIMEPLTPKLPYCWKLTEGFLNIRLPDEILNELEVEPYQLSREAYRVIIPGPVSGLDRWSYLRLAALGLIQWSVLKSLELPGVLTAGITDWPLPCGQIGSYLSVFRNLVTMRDASVDQRFEELDAKLSEPFSGETFIWLTPRFFPKERFSSLFARHISGKERVTLKCPAQNWLTGCELDLFPADMLNWPVRGQLALLVYLAGAVSSAEIDLTVPRLNEKDNLVWQLESTDQRLTQILEQLPDSREQHHRQPEKPRCRTECKVGLEGDDRILFHRLRYLRHFFWGAGIFGSVTEFLSVCSGFLSLLNCRFNQPAFRISNHNGDNLGREDDILAGANTVLSDMITEWDLLSGLAGPNGLSSNEA